MLAVLPAASSDQSISPKTLREIEEYFRAEAHRADFPGGTLAVVQGGDIVLSSAVGVSDLETNAPSTPETIYCIASLTKSFTATAILQLRDRGLVDLQAPVTRYLPWFRVAEEGAAEKITLQKLLTHTSGLPTNSHSVLWRDPPSIRHSIDRAVHALRWTGLHWPPARFEYSNMNYVVLGRVVEAVSGMSWDRYIAENIFQPLGMTHSAAKVDAVDQKHLAQAYWPQFGRLSAGPPQVGDFMAPASNILTTAGDLARYASAHLGTGFPLLSPATLVEAHSNGVEMNSGQRYAYGWVNEKLQGFTVVHHAGASGHSAEMYLVPQRHLGVVMLFGAYSHIQNDRIAEGVVSLALGKPAPPIPAPSELEVLLWTSRGLVGLAVACPTTLAILPIARRRQRRPGSRTFRLVRAGALALGAAALWFFVLVIIPRLVPELPLPFGFHGWLGELAVGAGMLLLTATTWALWGIASIWHISPNLRLIRARSLFRLSSRRSL